MEFAPRSGFFPRRIRANPVRYGIAVIMVALVLSLTVIFYDFARGGPLPLFFCGVAITAWYGGLGPGLLASVLSEAAICGFLIRQTDLLTGVATLAELSRLTVFLVFTFVLSSLKRDNERKQDEQELILARERSARQKAEDVERRLTVLVEASGRLITTLESSTVLASLVDLCQRFVGADGVAVWRLNESSRRWSIVHSSGLSEDFVSTSETIPDVTAQPLVVADVERYVPLKSRLVLLRREGIRSLLMVPVSIQGPSTAAILYYFRHFHVFTDAEVRISVALTNLAGSALVTAELYEQQARLLAEVRRSNEELQQFAYVTSHDLQEPLRMVSSYARLLGKRYAGKMDEDGNEFIGFLVDGAERMQNMIKDLLTYSRVATVQQKQRTYFSCEDIVIRVQADLRKAIEESAAIITHDPLPAVALDAIQLRQLFQNLIGNAIKYRKGIPHIQISAEPAGSEWRFAVKDDGIGIDPTHHERVFGIFKRLHGKDFPGTGIGLAVCKRIIELNKGHIWVDSSEGLGATFYFTLPAELVRAKEPVEETTEKAALL